MRVGIICEGSTDFAIFEALAISLVSARECVQLQPDFDRLTATPGVPGPGWQGVRKFLQTSAPGLLVGAFDLIIIHVDASVRFLLALGKSTDGDDELGVLEPLCNQVKQWASVPLPSSAVVVLPREDTESWLLAAHSNLKSVEAIQKPADELVNRGILESRNGRAAKDAERYRRLAPALVSLAKDRGKLRRVPELARFVSKLQSQLAMWKRRHQR